MPGVIYGVMDFVVGSGVGCLGAFLNFKILGYNQHSPYWHLPLAWAFVFLTSYLDKYKGEREREREREGSEVN
jgi:hypothetical protein